MKCRIEEETKRYLDELDQSFIDHDFYMIEEEKKSVKFPIREQYFIGFSYPTHLVYIEEVIDICPNSNILNEILGNLIDHYADDLSPDLSENKYISAFASALPFKFIEQFLRNYAAENGWEKMCDNFLLFSGEKS